MDIPMLIGLDARTIYTDCRRGIGKNLIDLYTTVAEQRPAWRTRGYHRHPRATDTSLDLPGVTPCHIEMPGDRVDAWGRWRLPLAAWRDDIDVLHCPANLCATWMPVPIVVTVHDLIPLELRKGRDPLELHRFEKSVAEAVAHASAIICPSRHTQNRLLNTFGADPARITVIPWAPDRGMRYRAASQREATLQRYDARPPYVLHLGASGPRKNTHRLIHAWHDVARNLRHRWQLLIVGLDPAFRYETQSLVDELDLSASVQVQGFAKEADLPDLFSGAEILAYPTLAEGFGLPLLDAFVTRTAVLSSDCSSIPEVADDAALLINPVQTEAIASGLEQLMVSTSAREQLVQRGTRRASLYTWAATAQQFVSLFESVAGRKHHSRPLSKPVRHAA